MKLKDRLKAIENLQECPTPHKILCAFGKMTIVGNQIAFGDSGDFLSEEELKLAIMHLVDELGGTVKWNRNTKEKK